MISEDLKYQKVRVLKGSYIELGMRGSERVFVLSPSYLMDNQINWPHEI